MAANKAHQIWFESNEIGEQVKLETVPRMFYGNNSRVVYTDGNRFGLKFYGMNDYVREWPYAVNDVLLFNGTSNDIIRFKGAINSQGNQLSGEGLGVFAVNETVLLMGMDSANGAYKVSALTEGAIELATLSGSPANLPTFYSRYIHIAVNQPNHVLGLYKVVAVNDTRSMFTVEKLGEPGWTAFPTQYDHYTTTLVSPVTPAITSYTIGPYLVCPEYAQTSRIEIDFFIPGLGRAESDGTITSVTLEVEIRYRLLGAATWQKRLWAVTRNNFDEFGRTYVIDVPLGTYEVEIERKSAQSGDISERDTAYCVRLKSRMPAPTRYKDVTTLALSIVGNSALSEAAESKIFVKPTRILPVRQNSAWAPDAPTRAVADFFAYVLRDIGFEWMLALPELDQLVQSTIEHQQTFNAVFDNESTVNEVMKRILAVAYAEPLLDFGQIIPSIERPRTHYGQMFCPDNYTKGLKIDINLFKPDEADGVEVEYMDPVTWKPATVLCTLPGDAGLKPEKIRMFGVTNKTQAWRLGMRQRRRLRYIRKGFIFQTEMDGLNAKYGSLCPLADNILNQSGRLKGYLNRVLTLNQPLKWTSGQQHVIGIRRPNGTLAGPYSCTPGATEYNAVIAQSLDFVPDFSGQQEPPFFIFGIKDKWAHMAIPRSITPSGTDKVKLVCENYDERVYKDDFNETD